MKTLINSKFILGNEYSEALSAEYFKKSGDLVIVEYPDVGLYLYRHFIELQLKSLIKRFGQKFSFIHDIKKLLENLENILSENEILNKEEIHFMSDTILSYIDLDEEGTNLRYPNSRMGENLITSNKFIEEVKTENLDNPYFYTLKSDEIKLNIDKLFNILYKIHDFLDETSYLKKNHEEDFFEFNR